MAKIRQVYAGNLPPGMSKRDLEYICEKYGYIRNITMFSNFAFVEFDDANDAEQAIQGLDGYVVDGHCLTFHETRGRGHRGTANVGAGVGSGQHVDGGEYQRNNVRSSNEGSRRPQGPIGSGIIGGRVRGSRQYCIIAENLGCRTNWKDLKDWARTAGRVDYTDIWEKRRKKIGIIKYVFKNDYERALSTLTDIKLDGHYVRVREYDDQRDNKNRSRSRSRGSRSRSRNGRKNRSRPFSRSRNRNDRRNRSRSFSRSRSRKGRRNRSRSFSRSRNRNDRRNRSRSFSHSRNRNDRRNRSRSFSRDRNRNGRGRSRSTRKKSISEESSIKERGINSSSKLRSCDSPDNSDNKRKKKSEHKLQHRFKKKKQK